MKRAAMLLAATAATLCLAPPAMAQVADLVDESAFRVCADPTNFPQSSRDGSGFENRLAELFAEKLGVPVQYTWFPQVIGFVRETLSAGRCDVVMGYAQGDDLVLNTNHYYTSTHVLVLRRDSDLTDLTQLADPRLQGRKLGVVAGSPPATHVARRGLMRDARPYDLMTDRRVKNPAGDMLDDVRNRVTDGALMWGPIAGPLIKDDADLVMIPLLGETATPRLFFRITMGVRAGEDEWKRQLNSLIRRHQDEIDTILRDAGVPLVDDYGKAMKPAP